MDRQIILVGDNIRSIYNVGAMYRSADAFGVEEVIFTGITPTGIRSNDTRLPHVIAKATNKIHKTALGAETVVKTQYFDNLDQTLQYLKNKDFTVYAIEQHDSSKPLPYAKISAKAAFIIGNEVDGIEKGLLKKMDIILEIPMAGIKESLNASVVAGIVLYHFRYN